MWRKVSLSWGIFSLIQLKHLRGKAADFTANAHILRSLQRPPRVHLTLRCVNDRLGRGESLQTENLHAFHPQMHMKENAGLSEMSP